MTTKSITTKLFRSSHVLALLFFSAILVGYFGRLFYPVPQLFYTPDYGRSDIPNFNLPVKYFLAENLANNQLPFWTKQIGTGVPIFAEGQIGALFIYNLLAFKFLPFWVAWNLAIPAALLFGFIGSYLFLRELKFNWLTATIFASVFNFSGFHIIQFHHINLIQTLAFMPWLFLLTHKLVTKPKYLHALAFAILLSQQLFAGYAQITYITGVGLLIYLGCLLWFKKPKHTGQTLALFILAGIFGLAFSAPQILPTLKLKQLSLINQGTTEPFRFPLPIKHLVTYIYPDYFGTPKDGSYPGPSDNWGLYWENVHYLGIIPIFLVGAYLLSQRRNKLVTWQKVISIVALISLLLALGKNSPLAFIFTLPGFRIFRIPSRYLILTTFSLSILAASAFDYFTPRVFKQISIRQPLLILVGVLMVFDIFNYGYRYHPIVTFDQVFAQPLTNQLIPEGERVFTHNSQIDAWNHIYEQHGWTDTKPFLYFQNSLFPNVNMLWHRPGITEYTGFSTKRNHYYFSVLTPSLLNDSAAKYIVTPLQTPEIPEYYQLVQVTNPPSLSLPPYYIYQNPDALDRFRFATSLVSVDSPEAAGELFYQKAFDFSDTVVLEQTLDFEPQLLNDKHIQVITDTPQQTTLQVTTDQQAVLVIADAYYPNWQATVNGQNTQVMPVNLNHQALIVPSGINTVDLQFIPHDFYRGLVVAGSALLISLIPFTKPGRSFLSRYSFIKGIL